MTEARREWLLLVTLLGAVGLAALEYGDLDPQARGIIRLILVVRVAAELHRRLARRGRAYVARATRLPGGQWHLQTGAGPATAVLRHAWGASLGPVIALDWTCEDGRRCQALLWRHRCRAPQWRRLRAHLRLA